MSNKKMMRLQKKGMIYYPVYDMVVTYKKNSNSGLIMEKLGFYNPNFNQKILYINNYSLSYWLNKGVTLNKNMKKYLVKFLLI